MKKTVAIINGRKVDQQFKEYLAKSLSDPRPTILTLTSLTDKKVDVEFREVTMNVGIFRKLYYWLFR